MKVGSLHIGGGAPVRIQSMAKTDTRDVGATVAEIKRLERAGCELVRVAVKDSEAAAALSAIKKKIHIPLIADIHFDPHLAIKALRSGVDKIRINPGTIRNNEALADIAKAAKRHNSPVRLGFNAGSVPRGRDMLSCAKETVKLFERCGFYDIIISLKTSDIQSTIAAYRTIASWCSYPLHVGLTATGLPADGIIKSSICIGTLLLEGVGDTIRVSLTGDPVGEVKAAQTILSSLGIRRFGPEIISCPTCGRCQVDLINIVNSVATRLNEGVRSEAKPSEASPRGDPRRGRGTRGEGRNMRIAIMGCEVNGPGEARSADIGIAAGKKSGVLFRKGKSIKRIKEKDFVSEILQGMRAKDQRPKTEN